MRWLDKLLRRQPAPPPTDTITEALRTGSAESREVFEYRKIMRLVTEELAKAKGMESSERHEYRQRMHELYEAKQMAGAGPWLAESARPQLNKPGRFRESSPLLGATSDLDLALSNIEWRREINLSWLEFSRWGIQQIILISRLYYIKHPWIRRGINLSAAYVFGQGVELSSPDEDANEVLRQFREDNKVTLGQIALADQERRKSYDGNLFWAIFADKANTGKVKVRIIDATEIQDIVTNPEDATEPWFYRRVWSQRVFDSVAGITSTTAQECWYPALDYEPDDQPTEINGIPVNWGIPVHHRRCGGIAAWLFGCPRILPALDYSREGKRVLEAAASVWQTLHQIALTITTKGGQQAIEGIKQQIMTTVGPSANLWDQNPPAVAGATFASGPGTKLEAFDSKNSGGDPGPLTKECRNMVACVLEIPPTWLGDMETSNLSTATTLDRPTELGFLCKQEEWQEDLVVLGRYALKISGRAPNGKLKEAMDRRKLSGVRIREAGRKMLDGHWVYEAAKKPEADVIEVLATFPAIREGDVSLQVKAVVTAMTLDNKAGQIIGIDEKVGVNKLYKVLGIDNADEITEEQYPDSEYDRDRTTEVIPPPIQKPQAFPGGVLPDPAQQEEQDHAHGVPEKPNTVSEARLVESISILAKLLKLRRVNGVDHEHHA